MNDTLRESLSALMDNEAEELELRRILKQMPHDRELRDAWRRYHLLSASLHQESHTRPSVDLLDGIHAALREEPLPIRAEQPQRRIGPVARYIGQSAIAASVALAVIFFADTFTGEQPDGFSASVAAAGAANTTGEYQPGELARTASFSGDANTLDPETSDRIREAVLRELERTPTYGGYQNLEIPVNYNPTED